MKTKFLTMRNVVAVAICLAATTNLFAGNPVTVKSGDVSVLKTPAKALLEVDYSTTKVGDVTLAEYLKKQGADHVKDWQQDKEKAISYFERYFNAKNKKGLQTTTDASEASYKIVIHVKNLDFGNAAGFFVSHYTGGAKITGTVDIIDLKTQKVVCNIYIDELEGSSAPSDVLRLSFMYNDLAVKMLKLK